MVDLTHIDPMIDADLKTCRVVIETPRGSSSKYTYDPALGAFELSGILPAGMSFPLDLASSRQRRAAMTTLSTCCSFARSRLRWVRSSMQEYWV